LQHPLSKYEKSTPV